MQSEKRDAVRFRNLMYNLGHRIFDIRIKSHLLELDKPEARTENFKPVSLKKSL